MWCIPPAENAAFVCQMESVLDTYKRAYDPLNPVICMDETTKQCTQHVREPINTKPGTAARYDGEYIRNGVGHLILFYSPLDNWRRVQVADNHAACEWAEGVRRLVEEDYAEAEKITLVMDNLNTHCGASLYKAFAPEKARELMDKLEFVFTPKHGSWLNMAECEFSVLARQCLDRRIPDMDKLSEEIEAWQSMRNENTKPVDWRFTTEDARIKLKHLYPNLDD